MQVKVWNDSDIDHVELFRDKEVRIPAHEYIEMGRSEANKFISQFCPVKQDGAGRHVAPKKLRIEKPAEEFAEMTGQPLKYEACDGKMFRTKVGVEEYEATLPESKRMKKNESGPRRRTQIQKAI
ncbi:MAG: hypothetical protein JSV32_00320 [Dehalococcoidia bacterium]|nr:MAG: hypothetical protein JSV32_00320 [Dehalococcoidia bacterium]